MLFFAKVSNVLAESYEGKRQIIIQLNVPWGPVGAVILLITLLCKAKRQSLLRLGTGPG